MSLGNVNVNEYWNASTNQPKLVTGRGMHGQGYMVSQSGTVNLDGITNWQIGDIAVFILDKWIKISQSTAVSAGNDGDIQIKLGTGLAALDRAGGNTTDYLARDNTYKLFSGGGGGSITGGGLGFNFASLADAMTTSLDAGVQWFRTAGCRSPGDMGDGLYVKLTSDPAWATNEPVSGGYISGRNAGVPRTADGAYWTLVPENGIVKPNQFGAVTKKEWNDPSFDQWAFFEDCIWFIVNQGYEHAVSMFIPSSWYYQTKPMTCHANTFSVIGGGQSRDGSVLWWPHTSHGIIVGYSEAGWITIDAEGGPYNGTYGGLFVGDTRYGIGADTNHVYVCTVAGIPGGWNATLGTWASPPTGTGSDIIDGTVHWAYQRELTRLEKFALTVTFKGAGGYFQHLEVYCGTDWLSVSPRSNHSGLVFRNRSIVENVFAASWPGCGIVFCSDGDTTFRGGSNSDGWRADHIICYWNGADGLHVGNSKTNAGTLIDGDFSANGRWGVANWCFLDNSYTSMQFAYDGNVDNGAHAEYPHGVSYNGRWYVARIPIAGLESGGVSTDTPSGYRSFAIYQSPAPDTNSFWVYIGGDGTWGPSSQYPAWSNTGLYEPGGGFSSNNFNDRTVVQKLYQESGTFACQFMPFNLILGGLLQWGYGGIVLNDRNWTQRVSIVGTAVNTTTGISKAIQYNFGYGSGGGLFNNTYPKVILDVNEYEGTRFLFEGSDQTRPDQTAWDFNTLATNGSTKYRMMRIGTFNSVDQWGTGVAQPGTIHISNLVIGDGGTDGRQTWVLPAPPTSGAHARGEYVRNRDQGVGLPKGWYCTVAGTPGTWVSEGNL